MGKNNLSDLLRSFAAATTSNDGPALAGLYPQLQAAGVPDDHVQDLAAAVLERGVTPGEVGELMAGGLSPRPRTPLSHHLRDPWARPEIDPEDILRGHWFGQRS